MTRAEGGDPAQLPVVEWSLLADAEVEPTRHAGEQRAAGLQHHRR